jgi:hypothetical protein
MQPEGAELTYKGFLYDFGTYYEVIVKYDPEDEAARDYADLCEDKAPATWDDAGMVAPELIGPAKREKKWSGVFFHESLSSPHLPMKKTPDPTPFSAPGKIPTALLERLLDIQGERALAFPSRIFPTRTV